MRRRGGSFVIAVVVAIGVITGAGHEVSAAPNGHAVCVAENIAFARSTFGQAAFVQVVLEDAHDGGAGDTIAVNATTDCVDD